MIGLPLRFIHTRVLPTHPSSIRSCGYRLPTFALPGAALRAFGYLPVWTVGLIAQLPGSRLPCGYPSCGLFWFTPLFCLPPAVDYTCTVATTLRVEHGHCGRYALPARWVLPAFALPYTRTRWLATRFGVYAGVYARLVDYRPGYRCCTTHCSAVPRLRSACRSFTWVTLPHDRFAARCPFTVGARMLVTLLPCCTQTCVYAHVWTLDTLCRPLQLAVTFTVCVFHLTTFIAGCLRTATHLPDALVRTTWLQLQLPRVTAVLVNTLHGHTGSFPTVLRFFPQLPLGSQLYLLFTRHYAAPVTPDPPGGLVLYAWTAVYPLTHTPWLRCYPYRWFQLLPLPRLPRYSALPFDTTHTCLYWTAVTHLTDTLPPDATLRHTDYLTLLRVVERHTTPLVHVAGC